MSKNRQTQRPTSQPTLQQPKIVTKCATCIFQRDLLHDCTQHKQKATVSGKLWIVLECAGHTLDRRPQNC
jgi:hypothetical protein